MEAKPIWASKTFWVNGVAMAASALTIVGIDLTPEFQAHIVMLIMGAANIALRLVTKSPVSISG